jgi:hypothetical protein
MSSPGNYHVPGKMPLIFDRADDVLKNPSDGFSPSPAWRGQRAAVTATVARDGRF